MNALNAISNSYLGRGASFFVACAIVSLAVAALALAIFYSSYYALGLVALSLKVSKYTFMAGCSLFVAAAISTALCHCFDRVTGRVEIISNNPVANAT